MAVVLILLLFLEVPSATAAEPAAAPWGPRGVIGTAGATFRSDCGVDCCLCSPSGSCAVGNCSEGGSSWEAAIEEARPGDVILLEVGVYAPDGALTIPAGTPDAKVVVANHEGADVTIDGYLRFTSPGYAWVEGIAFDDGFAATNLIEISSTTSSFLEDVTLKNIATNGGARQAIDIRGNVSGITVDGCDCNGGRGGHTIRIGCDDLSGTNSVSCSWFPVDVTIRNSDIRKQGFMPPESCSSSTCEDLLQLESYGAGIVVEQNLFHENRLTAGFEDGVDVKEEGCPPSDQPCALFDPPCRPAACSANYSSYFASSLVLRANDVREESITGAGVLVQGWHTHDGTIIERNRFTGGDSPALSLNASQAEGIVRNNYFSTESADTTEILEIRTAGRVTILHNTFAGSGAHNRIQLGAGGQNCPSDLVFANNVLEGTVIDLRDASNCDVGHETTFAALEANVLHQTSKDELRQCSSDSFNPQAACDSDGDCSEGRCLAYDDPQNHPGLVTADPRLTGFRIASDSSAAEAGAAPWGVADDIEGEARPQGVGYDIGCDELVSSGTTTTSGPSTTIMPTSTSAPTPTSTSTALPPSSSTSFSTSTTTTTTTTTTQPPNCFGSDAACTEDAQCCSNRCRGRGGNRRCRGG